MESDLNKKLRIVFMGTPEFAVASLAKLVDSGYEVVGVITAPDRPAGRGRKVQESAVKKYALEKGLPIWQPTNLKSEAFLEELKSLKANLQVVVAFRMLPEAVWGMPKYGTFNLHASLLPQYRGAAPINWAIMNGETHTGVTTFFIDEKIDTGEIILQEETHIAPDETAGKLHDRLMVLGSHLVLKTVQQIEKGTVTTLQQPRVSTALKTAHKIFKETCRIDWERPLTEIHDHIRGLSPYPGAWTTLHMEDGQEMLLKIYGATIVPNVHDNPTGNLSVGKKELRVAVSGGYLSLTEIQLPNKRKMKIHEALNGLSIPKNAFVR